MKILVTGVAGFIGSHVAEELLKMGYEVVGMDNLNKYYSPTWKVENLERLKESSKFVFEKTDVTDYERLSEVFERYEFESIVHLAARAGVRPSIKQPFLYEEVNIRGTLNLLELVKKHKVKQFVFASSSSVYGNQEKVPFSESDPVNEPVSPYAATKKAGEMLCHTYAHLYGIKTTVLRFFTVYGPYGRPDMAVYLFTEAITKGKSLSKFGEGDSMRDYTYIDDIVSGVVAAVENPFDYEVINLGNNEPVSLNDFIATLEEVIGKKAKIEKYPMPAGDVERTYADIEKAEELLGFEPETSLKEGLSKFVKWYKRNRGRDE